MFKWLKRKKAKETVDEINRMDDAQEIVDGKYVGRKYRVYRTSNSKFIVQHYDGYSESGWSTAIYEDYKGYGLAAKHFDTVAEAEKAARERAQERKSTWEAAQLAGPVKDLGRLP